MEKNRIAQIGREPGPPRAEGIRPRHAPPALGLLAFLILSLGCSSLPPLERRVRAGDLSGVKSLVEGGANVSDTTGCYTPLMIAVGLKQSEIAAYLLSKGAPVNQRSRECVFEEDYSGVRVRVKQARETALMFAQSVEMVALLIKAGADVNAIDLNGDTALVKAVRRGLLDVSRLLIEKGARTNLYQASGQNTLLMTLRYRLKKEATDRDKQLLGLMQTSGARDLVITLSAAQRTERDGVMHAYVHEPEKTAIPMPDDDARAVFSNPAGFDSTAYCAHHQALYHMSEFHWQKTKQNMWEWLILRRAYVAHRAAVRAKEAGAGTGKVAPPPKAKAPKATGS